MNVRERQTLVGRLDRDDSNPLDLKTWVAAPSSDGKENFTNDDDRKSHQGDMRYSKRQRMKEYMLEQNRKINQLQQLQNASQRWRQSLNEQEEARRQRKLDYQKRKAAAIQAKKQAKLAEKKERRRKEKIQQRRLEKAKGRQKLAAKKEEKRRLKIEEKQLEQHQQKIEAKRQLKSQQQREEEEIARQQADEESRLQSSQHQEQQRKGQVEERVVFDGNEHDDVEYIEEEYIEEEYIEEEILEWEESDDDGGSSDEFAVESSAEEDLDESEYLELEESAYFEYLAAEEDRRVAEEATRLEHVRLEEEQEAARLDSLSEKERAELELMKAAEEEHNQLMAEEEQRLRSEKTQKLSALEKALVLARKKADEESIQNKRTEEELKRRHELRSKRKNFLDVSQHLEEKLKFKPSKTMAEVEGTEFKEEKVPERQIGEVPPDLRAMIAAASLELRPVPKEHKKSYKPIAADAASMGRLTRLRENVIEKYGQKELEVAKDEARTKVLAKPRGRRTNTKREPTKKVSQSERILHEAAALGRMKGRKQNVISKYGAKDLGAASIHGDEESETDDKEIDDLRDEHGARVIRTEFLADRHMHVQKSYQQHDWLDDLDEDDPLDSEHVELPSNDVPKFKPKPMVKSSIELREQLSQAVAEGYWNRYSRLERPGAALKMTEGCTCKYCVNPTEAQTQAYQKKWADKKLSGIFTDVNDVNPDDDRHGWLTGLYLPSEAEPVPEPQQEPEPMLQPDLQLETMKEEDEDGGCNEDEDDILGKDDEDDDAPPNENEEEAVLKQHDVSEQDKTVDYQEDSVIVAAHEENSLSVGNEPVTVEINHAENSVLAKEESNKKEINEQPLAGELHNAGMIDSFDRGPTPEDHAYAQEVVPNPPPLIPAKIAVSEIGVCDKEDSRQMPSQYQSELIDSQDSMHDQVTIPEQPISNPPESDKSHVAFSVSMKEDNSSGKEENNSSRDKKKSGVWGWLRGATKSIGDKRKQDSKSRRKEQRQEKMRKRKGV